MPAEPVRILIAYSPADRFAAETVSKALTDTGLACDVLSGDPDDRAGVTAAVANASALLLLHSATATTDARVLRHAEEAASHRLPMLVVRLDRSPPSPKLTAFLRSVPWLDAANGKLPERLNGIIVRLKQLAGVPLGDADAVDDGQGGIDLWSVERRRVPRVWLVVGMLILAGLTVLAWRAYDRYAAQGAYDRGVARLAEGDLDAAAASLDDVIHRRPDWGLAWRQRGFASRDATTQIRYFSRAIELDPKDADALAARGRAYFATGDMKLARADLTAALALAPETADWYGDRGLAELLLNDEKAAASDFQRCAALDPHCTTSFGARITAVEAAQNRAPRDWFAPP